MGAHEKMAVEKIKKQTPPKEPISLRITLTENDQWKLINNHLMVCPGNGCNIGMCVYMRQLIAHDMDECQQDCSWCKKIIRWLRIHKLVCTPKRCPYYYSCSEAQKRMIKVTMRRHSDPLKLTATAGLPSPSTVTIDERKLINNVPNNDDDICCSDPINHTSDGVCDSDHLLKGSFTDVYQKALKEQLSESEPQIKNHIDHKLSMRQALISQLHEDNVYQEGRNWRRIRQIGSGGTGKAFCIEDVSSQLCLALKEEPDSDEAVREICVSFQVSSLKDPQPNIVEFYGAALLLDSSKMQLFLELMPCCLQSYLYSAGPLSMEDCHNYACQVFEALDFLHQKMNVVHADIKPGNLLIDDTIQRVKLADFGCSQVLEDDHHQGHCLRGDLNAGTIHYNPPEHYTERRCGYSLDIWQAGCCLIAMVTGRRPWRALYPDCKDPRKEFRINFSKFQVQKIAEICEMGQSHLIPGFLDDALSYLIQNCLTPDYRKRLSPRDCLSILVRSDIVLEKNRARWLTHLGTQPSSTSSFSPSFPNSSCIIDVYLGSHLKSPSPVYSLLPGWLGSIPCDKNISYGKLKDRLPNVIPIINTFPSYYLKICQNVPYEIWDKSRIDNPLSVRTITSHSILNLASPSITDTVNPSIAVVLMIC